MQPNATCASQAGKPTLGARPLASHTVDCSALLPDPPWTPILGTAGLQSTRLSPAASSTPSLSEIWRQ